jgi:hypothetical protein
MSIQHVHVLHVYYCLLVVMLNTGSASCKQHSALSLYWENADLFVWDRSFQIWVFLCSDPPRPWGRFCLSPVTDLHLVWAMKSMVWLWSVHRTIHIHIWLENWTLDPMNYPGITKFLVGKMSNISWVDVTKFIELLLSYYKCKAKYVSTESDLLV